MTLDAMTVVVEKNEIRWFRNGGRVGILKMGLRQVLTDADGEPWTLVAVGFDEYQDPICYLEDPLSDTSRTMAPYSLCEQLRLTNSIAVFDELTEVAQ